MGDFLNASFFVKQDPVLVATRVEKPNLRSTVRTFVRTTMSKSLAASFTWSGMGDKRRVSAKNNFRDNIIFKFLIGKFLSTKISLINGRDACMVRKVSGL